MSGIAAIVVRDRDASRTDPIARLTAALANRGPDGWRVRHSGGGSLGHARLRTGPESDGDVQPLTLDGRTWIVADCRIDGRHDLRDALDGNRHQLDAAPDAALILHAYLKWDIGCPAHLLGDFAFAIWDSDRRRLFCARDHLGIKPLHYASLAGGLVVGSTVESVRAHPEVPSELDDVAVADFLLFGHKTDASATTFRAIRRVPPAHALTWTPAAGCDVRRYWQLPIDEPRYQRDDESIDELVALVTQAVSDRLRHGRVGIFLSGGLDSTVLAATCARLLAPSGQDGVRAFTFVHDRALDDDSAHAEAAARHLGVPWRGYAADPLGCQAIAPSPDTPEPYLRLGDEEGRNHCYRDMVAYSPVAFFGEGPDNAMEYEWQPYLTYLMRQRRWGRIAADCGKLLLARRGLPGRGWLDARSTATAPTSRGTPPLPPWIDSALARRLNLDERWAHVMRPASSPHPVRPVAYFSLQLPLWHTVFDGVDPSYTGVPLEVRHPFLDIRVLRFLLSVPVVPWCRDKLLLRRAFRDVLPREVFLRGKRGWPGPAAVRPAVRPSDRVRTYGDVARFSEPGMNATPEAVDAELRFVALSHWLDRLDSSGPAAAPLG